MSIYEPEATPSLGAVKVAVVTAVANMAAPALAAEINAATSVEGTLVFRDWAPDVQTNSGTAPRRLGTKNQFPQEGLSNYQAIEVRYPHNPAQDDTHVDNKMRAALAAGTIRFTVERQGPDAKTSAFAVAQKSIVWKYRCGRQTRTRSGDDEFAEFEIVQLLYPMTAEVYGAIVT